MTHKHTDMCSKGGHEAFSKYLYGFFVTARIYCSEALGQPVRRLRLLFALASNEELQKKKDLCADFTGNVLRNTWRSRGALQVNTQTLKHNRRLYVGQNVKN